MPARFVFTATIKRFTMHWSTFGGDHTVTCPFKRTVHNTLLTVLQCCWVQKRLHPWACWCHSSAFSVTLVSPSLWMLGCPLSWSCCASFHCNGKEQFISSRTNKTKQWATEISRFTVNAASFLGRVVTTESQFRNVSVNEGPRTTQLFIFASNTHEVLTGTEAEEVWRLWMAAQLICSCSASVPAGSWRCFQSSQARERWSYYYSNSYEIKEQKH